MSTSSKLQGYSVLPHGSPCTPHQTPHAGVLCGVRLVQTYDAYMHTHLVWTRMFMVRPRGRVPLRSRVHPALRALRHGCNLGYVAGRCGLTHETAASGTHGLTAAYLWRGKGLTTRQHQDTAAPTPSRRPHLRVGTKTVVEHLLRDEGVACRIDSAGLIGCGSCGERVLRGLCVAHTRTRSERFPR